MISTPYIFKRKIVVTSQAWGYCWIDPNGDKFSNFHLWPWVKMNA